MATNYKLKDYALVHNRPIFFDANVLLYIFWPTGAHFYEANYSKVFSNLLKQKNDLFIDFLVISEVLNRVIRIEHEKINPGIKFKDFRDSQDGQDALLDIYLILKSDILPTFKITGKVFNETEIESFLVLDVLDINDKSIVELCKEKSLVLLTNDKDFKNSDIDILTGNPIILN
jgi:predicted nucleic acid-binding protein